MPIHRNVTRRLPALLLFASAFAGGAAAAGGPESVWIEAEHLQPIRGSCFPDMNGKTDGAWGLSGPGIAPEWTQGGESEWLSIACGPDEDRAEAGYDFEATVGGEWKLWVRYRDWRGQSELFGVRIEQPGRPAIDLTFGERPVVDEDDELKLLWKWAFGWDSRSVALVKGPARLTLLAKVNQPGHRQVDCFCLTTDPRYRPRHREKPEAPVWRLLDGLRAGAGGPLEPLAARRGQPSAGDFLELKSLHGRGFLYLWNVGQPWLDDLASSDPHRILFPYHVDPANLPAFREAFGGKSDLPIFSDPRLVPAFHGAGPSILENPHFRKWLDEDPGRLWAGMMNYADPVPLSERAKAVWPLYRERYAGNIAGESLGYFGQDAALLEKKLRAARSREEALQALSEIDLAGIAEKQKKVFGEAGPHPYFHTIPCLSAGMLAYAHLAREWGARAVGYESHIGPAALALRLAFLRGGARQYGGLSMAYRSSNFGDSSTIYSQQSVYAHPKYIYDNYYDAWAGAGMTWYKFDIWLQYLAGAAMFYHEQGFDEFWAPGGMSAGQKPLQLSPKGRLVEEFLALTHAHPERGTPVTPIAFLLDRAHGWDPDGYQPSLFGLEGSLNPTVLAPGRHGRMLKEWFKVAFHPYGPREAAPATGVNPTYVPGVFGDIFDVLVTSPTHLEGLKAYPVIVLLGEVSLSANWGSRLAAYMEQGGTLLACADQLEGPGSAQLRLPELGPEAEDDSFLWLPERRVESQRFRFRPIQGGKPLARASGSGAPLASVFERGSGRLVFISIPRGLGIDGAATPLVALVLAATRQGLLPLEVEGEVEWVLNRTLRGYLVGLFNPAGSRKPQHGVVVTDYAEERRVVIRASARVAKASEWFEGRELEVSAEGEGSRIGLTVPAGGARIVELEAR